MYGVLGLPLKRRAFQGADKVHDSSTPIAIFMRFAAACIHIMLRQMLDGITRFINFIVAPQKRSGQSVRHKETMGNRHERFGVICWISQQLSTGSAVQSPHQCIAWPLSHPALGIFKSYFGVIHHTACTSLGKENN